MKTQRTERLFIEELYSHVQGHNEKLTELVNIEPLTGDASARRYYRLFTESDTFVACLDNPCGENENTFVNMQKFLKVNKVRVPDILGKNLARGFILEEDLGDCTLLQYLSKIDSFEDEYNIFKSIIDHLIDIHNISQTTIVEAGYDKIAFDFEKLHSEIQFTTKHFAKVLMKEDNPKWEEKVNKLFEPICSDLSNKKMVLTHRDFHSRNVMVKEDEYIIIDFQDARMGIPQYDLVSLLDDCYYELTRDNRENLKKYYYDKISKDQHGQGSYGAFCETYDAMILQRVFKAVGSFCYIYALRKDERYLKYIGFAMEKLKRTMMKTPKYKELRLAVMDAYYAS